MERPVVKSVESREQAEGDGAKVRRSIGRHDMKNLDPFLMLDEFDVALPAGFPDHPHRGFETVTYVMEGKAEHEDFAGNRGSLGPGDLQWMTAGRGIVHAEMPNPRVKGLQLWVNLKACDKMMAPAYQELKNSQIPRAERDGVSVLVIAGESMGVQASIRTKTPVYYFDFTVKPGAAPFGQPIPSGWTCFAYTVSGSIEFSGTKIASHHAVVFGDGEVVRFENKDQSTAARFVLLAGQPLNEPVFQHGPFVMNSEEQISATINDYTSHKNGFEKARNWRSKIGHK